MRKYLLALFSVVIALPCVVFAHASPLQSTPAPLQRIEQLPPEIIIRFSERLESGASKMSVVGPGGHEVSGVDTYVSQSDPYTLIVPIEHYMGDGLYEVKWSVVSSDDGHFTRGSFPFVVGSEIVEVGTIAPPEVVTISTTAEALAMTLELFGNGIAWAVLVLLMLSAGFQFFAVRRVALCGVFFALTFVVCGAFIQLWIKISQLVILHGNSFFESAFVYFSTTAGSATVVRIGAIVFFSIAFFTIARRYPHLLSSKKVIVSLSLPLILFAYFRAIVSHATANPFFPEFSVLVNVLHLIEKDVWVGVCALVCICFFVRKGNEIIQDVGSTLSAFLTLNMAGISLTATYITWLHLKSFSNLLTTQWGEVFVQLACAAVVLVVLRAVSILSPRTARTKSWVSYLWGAEFAAALFVLYFSSVVIITSPPHMSHYGAAVTKKQNSVEVTIAASMPRSDELLVTTFSRNATNEPMVFVKSALEGEPQIVTLEKRFDNGFALPRALLQGGKSLQVLTQQEGAYDSVVSFEPEELQGLLTKKTEGERPIDLFTVSLMILALLLFVLAVTLYWYRMPNAVPLDRFKLLGGFLVLFVIFTVSLYAATPSIGNRFKKECLNDGNMWHLMPPTIDGNVTSGEAQEGCMIGEGQFHITDYREYRYLKNPPPTHVVLKRATFPLAVPAELEFTIQNEDGSAASLSLEHERAAHVIVVHEELADFMHLHPIGSESVAAYTKSGQFITPVTFSKPGRYLVAVDYRTGLAHRSEQFFVSAGSGAVRSEAVVYGDTYTRGEYEVSLQDYAALSGENATLVFTVKKSGKTVMDLEPYLGAAMHVAVVKNTFEEFIHTHGEVHTPGAQNNTIGANHVHRPPPTRFGPSVESHFVFPSPGLYTIFAEFKHQGEVIVSRFTLKVN